MTGKRLSHYEIVEEISRGGMGVVYRAVDVNLGREVAIKVLPDELVQDAGRRERLLLEARAASALEHPHIAVIHEVGDADGVTFIAMELIRGEKLSAVLSRGPLSQTRALSLAIEVAEGLARAHERDIVHRDLKPANVMITDDGHAKVIDFGLVKLLEPVGDDAATASVGAPRTEAGLVLGTAAYMSPEQARGARVDHRSDVFALGVMLYEMLTGRPAFHGQSSLDTMQAILTQPVPPLPAAADSSAEVTTELQRIIGKATAKDPDDRFQGMKDLVVDLRAARRRLESAPAPAVATPGSGAYPPPPAGRGDHSRIVLAVAAALAMVVAVGALLWWQTRRPESRAATASGKPAVAVLYFENNTGDESLDWMRSGLTDMLVTDLSQSPEFEVLGTDRLVQILQDLGRIDDRVLSAEVVQEIAQRAAVDNVLVGSYVKAGGAIRISARLQDAQTGRIVSAEKVEGTGEASLFGLVDELTRRFRERIAAASAPLVQRPGAAPLQAGLDRGLTDITTSSIAAFKYYTEGMRFHDRGLAAQAAPLLEEAIEIDPDFAMAHAKLAVVSQKMGAFDARDEYAKRALDLVDRLTTRERYYIEGFYYGTRPATLGRAIQAYQQGLRLHPEDHAMRHNLAGYYADLERYQEAIDEYEELLRRGTSFPSSYGNFADFLIQTGKIRRAREIADDYVQRYPNSAGGFDMQGNTLIADGRFADARSAFEKSEALDPVDGGAARRGRLTVALLEQKWGDLRAVNEELSRSRSPFQRFLGLVGEALLAGAHGRGQAVLEFWDRAARLDGLSAGLRAAADNRVALLLLRHGKSDTAVAQAERALAHSRSRGQEFETLQLLAVAQAAVGRKADSARTFGLLESRAKSLPSDRELRRVYWARGEMARQRGDSATAATELSKASAMLPVHGSLIGWPPSHGDLWYAAAVANIGAGRDAEAARLLERLQSSHDRWAAMEAWARSFYLLGGIYERRGETDRAREQYRQFVDLWRDGDLERAWLGAAERKLGS